MAKEPMKKASLLQRLARQGRPVAVTLALVVFALDYFLLVGPSLSSVALGGPYDVDTLKTTAETKEAEAEKVKAAIAEAEDIPRESRLKIDMALPPAPRAPELIAVIDSIASDAGMRIQTIEITEQKEGLKTSPDIGLLMISLTLSGGDYPTVKRLLSLIEHDLRLIDVGALSMSPSTASLTLTMSSYYLKPQATISTTATATPGQQVAAE